MLRACAAHERVGKFKRQKASCLYEMAGAWNKMGLRRPSAFEPCASMEISNFNGRLAATAANRNKRLRRQYYN